MPLALTRFHGRSQVKRVRREFMQPARWLVLVLALALFPAPAGVAAPGLEACEDYVVHVEQTRLTEFGCGLGEIRPGVAANGCTLIFVMTDGVDLYIGTAGHCGGVGKKWSITGVGTFGTTVFREFNNGNLLDMKDWALILIDPAFHHKVNPTMVRFGGPTTNVEGFDARAPLSGDPVLQYGHGRGFGKDDATKGRASVIAAATPSWFVYPGTVGPGDSGSPVRFATGEAAGIAVIGGVLQTGDNSGYVEGRCAAVDSLALDLTDACLAWDMLCPELDGACTAPFREDGLYGVVIVTRFDRALEAFETHLGRDLTVVEGTLPAIAVAP